MISTEPSFHSVFWLGLEKLHELTSSGKWTLKVRVTWDRIRVGRRGEYVYSSDPRAGSRGEAEWDDFKVGSEATNYQLGVGNQLRASNWLGDVWGGPGYSGMQFTTSDRDNDYSGTNCASNRGGWWFRTCYRICLTCSRPAPATWDGTFRLPPRAEMWIMKA